MAYRYHVANRYDTLGDNNKYAPEDLIVEKYGLMIFGMLMILLDKMYIVALGKSRAAFYEKSNFTG